MIEVEEFISGYCRCLDASRMVAVEGTAQGWEIDCAFGHCAYEPACQIAQQIRKITEKPRGEK